MRIAVVALAGLLLGWGTLGCSGSAKREAFALDAAVDRYRRAPGDAKAAQAAAVTALGCTDPEVCRAKQACLAALEPTTRAFALKDEVSARLRDLEAKTLAPNSAEANALPDKLDEATKLLEDGRAKMADCDQKLAQLRAQYGG